MKQRIMIDLETMATCPRAAIVSVGAVEFGEGRITREFYRRVDLGSCAAAGLVIEADTLRWWLRQDEEARRELTREWDAKERADGNIGKVLYDLGEWLDVDAETEIWSNGAAADAVWLQEAYGACFGRETVPWRHWQVRCFRTLKELSRGCEEGIVLPPRVAHHHALADARYQALHAIQLLGLAPAPGRGGPLDPDVIYCEACGDTGTVERECGVVACGCWLGHARQMDGMISPVGPIEAPTAIRTTNSETGRGGNNWAQELPPLCGGGPEKTIEPVKKAESEMPESFWDFYQSWRPGSESEQETKRRLWPLALRLGADEIRKIGSDCED